MPIPVPFTKYDWLGPRCQCIAAKASDEGKWVCPKLKNIQKAKKINLFPLFLMEDPPSLLFWSQHVISSRHLHISGKTVVWSLSKHNFDAIIAMGPVCFEWNQSCSRANPTGIYRNGISAVLNYYATKQFHRILHGPTAVELQCPQEFDNFAVAHVQAKTVTWNQSSTYRVS